jgi:hypothetical protein
MQEGEGACRNRRCRWGEKKVSTGIRRKVGIAKEIDVVVKYQFLIGIRWRFKICLRDEVCISKTKWSRCRGKVSESERNTEPVYWKGKTWLQLVRCALLYA